ncbi:A/G-specific adenine glycosylase [Gloeothece verrucosa]|uniref:Adenine DNA glycosylase n=1 Tax=Gloeothece verrucosa (strain PCC 7822) TaxID=497965 RepID=E0UIU3_GLOV7|nr:A/G-specific adenine glycosylase [Gloeothece verrucosa]ADN13402.1 A/G-specific adenine glycosylase [Gloeothece verrucosa PCC 7822]
MACSETTGWPGLDIVELRQLLLSWYQKHHRDLPWRNQRNPYYIWVSEVMLQQTQVATVIPYFHRWLERFPTIDDLAQAELQPVLKAWEGLGYYARARNLHKAAKLIIKNYNGFFPNSLAEVLSLPGIGRTTAGGILSAAFNQPVSILDGNVKRVLSRLIALSVPPSQALPQLWALSDHILDPDNPRDFNQALMDLGATVCTRANPKCDQCPWQGYCQAYNKGIQSRLPMREESTPIPHKRIGVAVIYNHQEEILIDRRPTDKLLGGLWEFPGGKIEADETVSDCIKREILEELAIEIEVGEHIITVDHAYTHFRVSLFVHACRYLGGEPQPIGCEEIRWVKLDELDQFPFPKANIKIIEALKERHKKT